MVMAACTIDEKDQFRLKDIGVKDSKLLSPEQRDALFPEIIKMVKSYATIVISAEEIDAAVTSSDPNMNLNWLEATKSSIMINKLKPQKVILDCPTSNLLAYKNFVRKIIVTNADIIAEHKADVNHPIVSAASIIAKVLRDKEIELIKKQYDIDFGSGYPSDPKTIEFIKDNYEKFPIFRKSWATYKTLVNNKAQTRLGQY